MDEKEISERFLSFFEKRGHKRIESAPLVLTDDPTLLFTNAGMAPFKSAFLGITAPPALRATSCQRCLRTSDIEKVGTTPRHLTFFEMLGNFSFGDYFKEKAIDFAWQLLTDKTEGFGIDGNRLWFSIFHEDEEAGRLWEKIAGVKSYRILPRGEEDNFWRMGETGPCGPCSEILFDLRGVGLDAKPDEDKNEALEIWNLVFMQFNRKADGTLEYLPKQNVDTGAGLERLAVALNAPKEFNPAGYHITTIPFEISLFSTGILKDIYENFRQIGVEQVGLSRNLAIASDHSRAAIYAISDGVVPSNQGRGYVVRLLIRKALVYLYRSAIASASWACGDREFVPNIEPFFLSALNIIAEKDRRVGKMRERISQVLLREARGFLQTLSRGLGEMNRRLSPLYGDTLPGKIAFELHDTYGFPIELTRELARERGLMVDEQGFREQMKLQKERARKARKQTEEGWTEKGAPVESSFEGYHTLSCPTEIRFLRRRNDEVQIGLVQTPFYAEAGGQIGDAGWLRANGLRIRIHDTQYSFGTILHIGEVEQGEPEVGMEVIAEVDGERRSAIRRAHTATHLLHAGLRQIFGPACSQAGSLVAPDYLRFDYYWSRSPNPKELQELEARIHKWILMERPVRWQYLPYAEAIARGAIALFGEKYGETVRMVEIEGISQELCGGTHLDNTLQVGLMKILSDEGIGAGIRRISAITGWETLRWAQKANQVLIALSSDFSAPLEQVLDRYQQWKKEKEIQGKREQRWKSRYIQMLIEKWMNQGEPVLSGILEDMESRELAEFCGAIVKKVPQKAAVFARRDSKQVHLVLAIGKEYPEDKDAVKILSHVAFLIGGRAGGKPNFAQAGGNQPQNLEKALEKIRQLLTA